MPHLHDPQARLDYTVDWDRKGPNAPNGTGYLETDETIITSTWSIAPTATLDNDVFDTISTTVWVSGLTLGTVYHLINHVETSEGREDDRSITIRCANQ